MEEKSKNTSIRAPIETLDHIKKTAAIRFAIMSVDDFTCGYGVRFLYTSPHYKHDRKSPTLESEEDIRTWGWFEAKDEVVFTATPEVMEYAVCQSIEEQADRANNDMLNTAIGRSETHILKIAMLLEIGKPPVTGYFVPCIRDVRLEDDATQNNIVKIITILKRLGWVLGLYYLTDPPNPITTALYDFAHAILQNTLNIR